MKSSKKQGDISAMEEGIRLYAEFRDKVGTDSLEEEDGIKYLNLVNWEPEKDYEEYKRDLN